MEFRRVILKMNTINDNNRIPAEAPGKDPELLIWVNDKNEIIGCGEKLDTHFRGQLHRAFSIFIYDPARRELLLQKRAKEKYHSGGLWSNSCCSHPRKGETWSESLSRCLREELGLDFPVVPDLSGSPEHDFTLAGEFRYYSHYGELAEHEWDYVFLCRRVIADDQIILNHDEAEDYMWISPAELDRWLDERPGDFTSWFARAYHFIKKELAFSDPAC